MTPEEEEEEEEQREVKLEQVAGGQVVWPLASWVEGFQTLLLLPLFLRFPAGCLTDLQIHCLPAFARTLGAAAAAAAVTCWLVSSVSVVACSPGCPLHA
jgi:hypothetical protein